MRDKVFSLVEMEIKKLNEDLDYESLEKVDDSTPIYGGSEGIDSLSLIALISAVEAEILKELGYKIVLADEDALNQSESPYSTVGNLINFILKRISEKSESN